MLKVCYIFIALYCSVCTFLQLIILYSFLVTQRTSSTNADTISLETPSIASKIAMQETSSTSADMISLEMPLMTSIIAAQKTSSTSADTISLETPPMSFKIPVQLDEDINGKYLIYLPYSPLSNCKGGGSNKLKWVAFSEINRPKTKNCTRSYKILQKPEFSPYN